MSLASDLDAARKLLTKAVKARQSKQRVTAELAKRRPLKRQHYTVGVYFADGAVNLYQMRQWYAPLEQLSAEHPVLVIARNAESALAIMHESSLDVVFAPKVTDLEALVDEQPLRVVLYVNQNTRNFQMMRYGKRFHVFINHGESDKVYMTTNQFKTYDYALIAGEAARKRLSSTLWGYDVDTRTIDIGRPQADHFVGTPPFEADERVTVLYSPTWEGDRPSAAYGSVASHGVALAQALLNSPRHRLIYRPHPRSGVVDTAFGKANQQIIDMIARANQLDPSAKHVFDTSGEITWQLSLPDIAICDVSAMIYDRLAVGKPLIVAQPINPSAEIDEGGYLSDCEWLSAADAGQIIERIDEILDDPEALTELETWSRFHFGDTTPGAPTKRFHDAIDRMMAEWQAYASAAL